METPHIKFTWSSEALASILKMLGVSGLGSFDKTTELYSTWPDQEEWALYTSKLMQWMPTLLSQEERETLEQKLSAVESAFNTYLSQADADNKEQRIAELGELIKQLEEIESLICDRGSRASHAAYPYFARWFTLHLAVLKAFTNYEDGVGQLREIKLWWDGHEYLEQVFHSAYTARASQVTTSITGAFMNRIYVRDEQTGTSLTTDVTIGGEDENAILNIQQFLRSEAGWQYIKDISFEENVKIFEEISNTLVVTADSPTEQDQVFDVSQFWRDKQEMIENEIAEQRKACDPAFDSLINHEARKPSLLAKMGAKTPVRQKAAQPQKADQQQLVQAFINAYRPLVLATAKDPVERQEFESNFPSAIEIIGEVVPNLLGMIPVAGDLLGTIMGTFFMFLGSGPKPNPWVEFEKKMERLVDDTISDFNANDIKNRLQAFDQSLRLFFKEYSEAKKRGQITPSEIMTFKSRASTLISEITNFEPSIITPASGSYYKIAPYYEHFFVTFMVILALAKSMNVETYNFVDRRTELYNKTNTFIGQAINGIAQKRASDVNWKTSSSFIKGTSYWVYDNRFDINLSPMVNPSITPIFVAGIRVKTLYADKYLSDNFSEYQSLTMNGSKKAVELITAIQLLRELCICVDGIIGQDTESSFNKSTIKDIYRQRMGNLHTELLKSTQKLKSNWNHPAYAQKDLILLNDCNGEVFKDFQKKPPHTIFHIPMQVTITPGTYYYIFSKVSGKALDVAGGGTANMTNIQQWSIADVDQQKWRFEDAGNGYFYIISKKSGKVLAVAFYNVVQYEKTSAADEGKWKLEDAGNGYFYILNKQYNTVLDMSGSYDDGANVQVYPKQDHNNLKWSFEAV